MKLVVTEPCPASRPTIESIPVGSVFQWEKAWYLKLAHTVDSYTDVWGLSAGYRTHFKNSGILITLPNSVEVRITP